MPVFAENQQDLFNLTPDASIKLLLLDKLRSGDSKKNEQVNYKVDEDVFDKEGNMLIRKGTPAYGTVLTSRRAGMLGRRGSLDISVDYTTAVDGQRVNLRASKEKRGGGDKGLITAGALLVAWPLAFFKGSNVSIDAGTTFVAYVKDSLKIETGKDNNKDSKSSSTDVGPAAPASKLITMKNGDRISGQISSLNNGVYVVKTSMGELAIKESEIATIESTDNGSEETPKAEPSASSELAKKLEALKNKRK